MTSTDNKLNDNSLPQTEKDQKSVDPFAHFKKRSNKEEKKQKVKSPVENPMDAMPSDVELQKMIESMTKDPEFQKLMEELPNDPEFQKMMEELPKIQEELASLKEDPMFEEVQKMIQNGEIGKVFDDPDFMKNMEELLSQEEYRDQDVDLNAMKEMFQSESFMKTFNDSFNMIQNMGGIPNPMANKNHQDFSKSTNPLTDMAKRQRPMIPSSKGNKKSSD